MGGTHARGTKVLQGMGFGEWGHPRLGNKGCYREWVSGSGGTHARGTKGVTGNGFRGVGVPEPGEQRVLQGMGFGEWGYPRLGNKRCYREWVSGSGGTHAWGTKGVTGNGFRGMGVPEPGEQRVLQGMGTYMPLHRTSPETSARKISERVSVLGCSLNRRMLGLCSVSRAFEVP